MAALFSEWGCKHLPLGSLCTSLIRALQMFSFHLCILVLFVAGDHSTIFDSFLLSLIFVHIDISCSLLVFLLVICIFHGKLKLFPSQWLLDSPSLDEEWKQGLHRDHPSSLDYLPFMSSILMSAVPYGVNTSLQCYMGVIQPLPCILMFLLVASWPSVVFFVCDRLYHTVVSGWSWSF